MTKVNVAVEFVVAEVAEFDAEVERVSEQFFELAENADFASDPSLVSDSSKRLVVLTCYGEGQTVYLATANALAVVLKAVETAAVAQWHWQATHVTPADAARTNSKNELLSA